MHFFNLPGFFAMISLPVIIVLYTVKQKSKTKQVSSLYLWEKIRTDKSGVSFLQKLRNNIFLYLNLLSALLITLALTEAYINRGIASENLIIVIDNSLSMQSVDVQPSRLEEAKKQAVKLIDNKPPTQLVSVVTLNTDPQILSNRQTDKLSLRKAVNSIQGTFGGCDGQKTAALIDSLGGENTKVYVFSDNKTVLNGEYDQIDLSKDNENCAVTNLSRKVNDKGGVSIFALVENRGTKPVEKTIGIYADNKIIDSFIVTIQPGSKTQALADTDFMPSEVVADISPKDSLPVDDTRYLGIAGESIKKVLLITKGNIFLEKALNVQPDVELYKGDEYNGAKGYDCYVFDGITPESYPDDGDVMIFNCDGQGLFTATDAKEITDEMIPTGKGGYFNDLDFSVRSSRGIESNSLSPMLTSGGRVIMSQGEADGRNVFVCGFDLHDSDLPLKMDFPILIYNILNDFDESRLNAQQFIAGEPAVPNIRPDTVTAEIQDPEGKKKEIKNGSFIPESCGIYSLYENGKETAKIAVNCDTSYIIDGKMSQNSDKITVNYKLRHIFLILALIIMLAEIIIYLIRIKADKRVICLRIIIFILMICSITDFSFTTKTTDTDTVFILDRSESMNNIQPKAVEFINNSLKNRKPGDFTALMAFGGNSSVDSGLNNNKTSYSPSVVIDKTETDIENAVNTASGLFSDERGKHIVLLTDGKETKGNAASIAKSDIDIDIVNLASELENEVQISRLKLPSKINKNTNFDITLQIDSLTAQNCKAVLYKNNRVIYENELKIEKGENRFVVRDHADDTNNVVYKCVITPEKDTYTENNTLYEHTYVQDTPVALVLEKNGSGENIYGLVSSFGLNAKRADISAYSQQSEQLGENDLVIIADCPIEDMSDDFLENLEGYVRNSSGGLIVTGGENSFALGNYKDSIMEKILPVDMDMVNEEINGDVAFFMVSDRSGSMSDGQYGRTKLSMVKDAMAGAVQNLNPNDTVAVLAFDDKGEWVVEPTTVGSSTDSIMKKISGISIGGGTSILPSLQEAYNEILKSTAVYKHIILMTDGQAETEGYDELIENMKAANITLSTIAVGSDSDTSLLKGLAEKSGGRYYYTDEFSDLPNIFSREAKLAGRDYINNGMFYPSVSSDDEIINGIDSIPALYGYIAAKNKTAGKMILSSEFGDPILSTWQYGLGRTAAFTSDMQNFCGDWLSSAEGRTILKNLVSSTMRRPSGLDGEISYTENGKKGIISIDFANAPQSVNGGSINNKKIELSQTSIGHYEAETEKLEQGSYTINISVTDSEGNESVINDGVDIGYSREFDLNYQSQALKNISGENINFITAPSEVFTPRQYKVKHSPVLYKWLLPLALLLFLTEIFLRRIGVIKLPKKEKTIKRPKAAEAPTKPQGTTQMLLSNKRNRNK